MRRRVEVSINDGHTRHLRICSSNNESGAGIEDTLKMADFRMQPKHTRRAFGILAHILEPRLHVHGLLGLPSNGVCSRVRICSDVASQDADNLLIPLALPKFEQLQV